MMVSSGGLGHCQTDLFLLLLLLVRFSVCFAVLLLCSYVRVKETKIRKKKKKSGKVISNLCCR